MDHPQIEEQQIVDRYLAGRLDAAETEQFEEHYLSCQQCLGELELAEAFGDGIRLAAAEDALKTAVARRVGFAVWLAQAVRSPRGGLMAALVMVLVALPLAFSVYQRSELRARDAELAAARAPQANTVVLGLSAERGGPGEAPSVRLRLPEAPGWIVLSLDLERPPLDHTAFESYRVRLFDAEGSVLWTGETLKPNHLDALAVSLHTSFLAAGDYELRAEHLRAGNDPVPAGRFAFRVLPAGS